MIDLDSKIKTLWVRQLKKDWEIANYHYFRNRMQLPNIDLLTSENILGKWDGAHKRNLLISAFLIKNYPWAYSREVLYHEMAHQYVEEILKIRDALPHGEVFQKICHENCFDHKASGDLQTWAGSRSKSKLGLKANKMIDKIHKLLALAQSQNQHEAQLAMVKAQELLLKYNISLLDAETNCNYIHKQIGEIGRRNPMKSLIGTILAKYFFIEAIWVFGYDQHKNKEGRVLEIHGTPENIEMAEYVHDYLHNISEVLWLEHRHKKKITGNRHRRTFTYGLLHGFSDKLEMQVAENKSRSLIWKGDPRLREYYRRRNPRICTERSYYSGSSKDAYNSGLNKGKDLVIHKGIHDRNLGKVHFLN